MAMLFDNRLELRLTTIEKRTLERCAAAAGMNSSQYLRFLIHGGALALRKVAN